jgi:hypothetical protein
MTTEYMAALKCEQCNEIREIYRAATARLADGAKRLAETSISHEMDTFFRIWHEVQRLNLQCRQIRKSMLHHLEAHRACGPANLRR